MNQQPIEFKIDKVSFELQDQHDFTWLQSIGTVFCVFDQQDSGNLSFGVEMQSLLRLTFMMAVFCMIFQRI